MQRRLAVVLALVLALLPLLPVEGSTVACTSYSSIVELYDDIVSATAGSNPEMNVRLYVCASSTPISWEITDADGPVPKLDALGKIYLNRIAGQTFTLNCVVQVGGASDYDRCILDFGSPNVTFDPTDAYQGFIIQDSNHLTLNGFELVGRQTKNAMFTIQTGGGLTIQNSVIRNNGQITPDGKDAIIVRTSSDSGIRTTIENSYFYSNEGTLIGITAGDAVIQDCIFNSNGLPAAATTNQYQYSAFISWSAPNDGSNPKLTLTNNHFVGFQSSADANAAFPIAADERYTTQASSISLNVARDNNVGTSTCNGGIYVKPTGCQAIGLAGDYPDDHTEMPQPHSHLVTHTARRYFTYHYDDNSDVLNLVPDSSSVMIDSSDEAATLTPLTGSHTMTHPGDGSLHTAIPPTYSTEGDSACIAPSEIQDPDSTWPGLGCACFLQPSPSLSDRHISLFDIAETQDVTNPRYAHGYKSAVETSETGGLTIRGWFKAGDTSGYPHSTNNQYHPGKQQAKIFIKGEKATWAAGYYLGMGSWNSFGAEFILKGPSDTNYRFVVTHALNAYPGIDVWNYVTAIYDAELGEAKLFVNNMLVGYKSVPFNWKFDWARGYRDIQWSTQSSLIAETRIGGGFETKYENFIGCTGGMSIFDGVPEISDSRTGSPSSQPSESPSITSGPSSLPSQSPSVSSRPSGQPSESPSVSGQPSSMPSESPSFSSRPSSVPSQSPSVSGHPSSEPSTTPSISAEPSSIPSETPSISVAPSVTASRHPSHAPSITPSISAGPSSIPSETPSISVAPSVTPSTSIQPTKFDSAMPSASPSMTPTISPAEQTSSESTVEGTFQFTAPGTITIFENELCSLDQDELDALASEKAIVIKEEACLELDDMVVSCVVEISDISCNEVTGRLRRGLSRSLQSGTVIFDFNVAVELLCSNEYCHGSDVYITANQYYDAITNNVCQSIEDGTFLESLRASTSAEVNAFLDDATITCDFELIIIPLLSNRWYPDWLSRPNRCMNDGNEPHYMFAGGQYYASSLESCCEKYFSWDFFECTGEYPTSVDGYFPDWSGDDSKCINDSELLPDYMRISPQSYIFNGVEDCCNAHFAWEVRTCIVNSGGVFNTTTSDLYYPDWVGDETCKNDNNQPAYMEANPSLWMFPTLDECCSVYYPSNYASCLSTAQPPSYKYYMSYADGFCVQDCFGGVPCGGLADTWKLLYLSRSECCDQENWWNPNCIEGLKSED